MRSEEEVPPPSLCDLGRRTPGLPRGTHAGSGGPVESERPERADGATRASGVERLEAPRGPLGLDPEGLETEEASSGTAPRVDLNFGHCSACALEWRVPEPREGVCTRCRLPVRDGPLPRVPRRELGPVGPLPLRIGAVKEMIGELEVLPGSSSERLLRIRTGPRTFYEEGVPSGPWSFREIPRKYTDPPAVEICFCWYLEESRKFIGLFGRPENGWNRVEVSLTPESWRTSPWDAPQIGTPPFERSGDPERFGPVELRVHLAAWGARVALWEFVAASPPLPEREEGGAEAGARAEAEAGAGSGVGTGGGGRDFRDRLVHLFFGGRMASAGRNGCLQKWSAVGGSQRVYGSMTSTWIGGAGSLEIEPDGMVCPILERPFGVVELVVDAKLGPSESGLLGRLDWSPGASERGRVFQGPEASR